MSTNLAHSPLGRTSEYISQYQPDLLFPISRQIQRDKIGIPENMLPFQGEDIWNGYELSWLNAKGKPVVACAEFRMPCISPNLIESKSFKLYLNSFNNTVFPSEDAVLTTLQKDLSAAVGAPVQIKLNPVLKIVPHFSGIHLDKLDITCDTYKVDPGFLITEQGEVTETLYSDLLKSNCPVTGQPDWASVQITYTGKKIQHEGLLRYFVSFRNYQEFHEQCVEKIFVDLMTHCGPQKLFVQARYTRRGGLDINPYRANYRIESLENTRLLRQ